MTQTSYIAFCGKNFLADGSLIDVALAVRERQDRPALEPPEKSAQILIFDAQTSYPVDLDLRGTPNDIRLRLAEYSPPHGLAEKGAGDAPAQKPAGGRGRPSLGVEAHEVTLLPRHWQWLREQPGGASVALRKLTQAAMRDSSGKDSLRRAQESAYRFMAAMAGDAPGFDEAARALFASDSQRFAALVAPWSPDIRAHLLHLAKPAFSAAANSAPA